MWDDQPHYDDIMAGAGPYIYSFCDIKQQKNDQKGPGIYAAPGTLFPGNCVDTGLLMSVLRDSTLWYGNINKTTGKTGTILKNREQVLTENGKEPL